MNTIKQIKNRNYNMKIQIEQRSVYHKIAVVEIEVDADDYEHFKLDNGKFTGMDDYLLENGTGRL